MLLAAIAWPTWQQAWLTTIALVLASIVLRRRRPTQATETLLPATNELIVLTAIYGLWRSARKLPLYQTEGAMERARDIVDLQNALRIPTELSLQQWVLQYDWLGRLSALYYAGMHTPGIIAFLVWLFVRHRDHYSQWRNALAVATAGCLVIRFWRVAPPRFLTELGYQDLSEIYNSQVYGPVGTGVSQQFAAMPSIHVAWAAVIGFGVMAASNSAWRWLFAAHLPVTFLVVSATGHHWWLDGIVALALVALGFLLDRFFRPRLSDLVAKPDVSPPELAQPASPAPAGR